MADATLSEKLCDVYRVTCAVNGKAYVGIAQAKRPTIGTRRRWRHHVWLAENTRNGSFLQRAIRKYGKAAFVVETIYTAASIEEGRIVERALIAQYGTLAPLGYNLTSGGEKHAGFFAAPLKKRVPWSKGKKMSPESRQKMRLAKLGRKLSPDHCAKLSAVGRGRKQSSESVAKSVAARAGYRHSDDVKARLSTLRLGKTMSPDACAKISATLTGRKMSPEAIAKSAAARRGRKLSSEHKAKLAKLRRAAPSRTACGHKGVRRSHKKWMANIKFDKKEIYLGSFDTAEEASAAYNQATEIAHQGPAAIAALLKELKKRPRPSWSSTGFSGVARAKGGRFQAYIQRDNIYRNLGTFPSLEAAVAARRKAEQQPSLQ